MSQIVTIAEDTLRARLAAAAAAAFAAGELPAGELPPFTVEIPADRAHGDLSANAALVSARTFHRAPRQIAETLLRHLDLSDT